MTELSFDTTPQQLLEDGSLQHGVFRQPIPNVNIDQFRVPGTTGWTSRFRLKQWQHWLISGPDVAFTIAMVHVGYLKLGWIQAIERSSGKRWEWKAQSPFARCNIARSLWEEQSDFKQSGCSIQFDNHLSTEGHTLHFKGNKTSTQPGITGHLVVSHPLDQVDPLVVCQQNGDDRAMYSHKVPLPVQGNVTIGDRHFNLSSDNSTAFSDIHKGHYPHHTWWDWACFAFLDDQGRIVGLNLTHGLAQNPRRYNENAMWLDGQPIRLGLARFQRNRGNLMQPWKVETDCGSVQLDFHPLGGRGENLQLGFISSQFQQLYGHWSGSLRYRSEVLQVEQVFGLGEDHECHW